MSRQLFEGYSVRNLRKEDGQGPYRLWFEDRLANRFNSHGIFSDDSEGFEALIRGINDRRHVVWAILHSVDGHIGNVGLHRLDFVNRTGELGIAIGDSRHWGMGLGTRVCSELLDHGFRGLNLHRIHCATASSNAAMLSLAQRLGMKEEGRRRDHLYLEGHWLDSIEFGILKSEFEDLCDLGAP